MALYKRPSSKYYWFKFFFDGVLVQRSSKTSNKADARQVEAEYRRKLLLGGIGIHLKKDVPTFDKAVADFLKWSKINRSGPTHKRLVYAFLPLQDYFGKVKVDRIETKDVENFVFARSRQVSKRTKGFITRETVNHELCALKMLFRRLVDNDVVVKNPAYKVKRLPENDRKFHVLTREEERRYLLACPPQLQDVATVMLETGMRCGEVYRIKRNEVFLNEGYLKVTKGKTQSSIRRVYLTDKAKNILAARMRKFDGENLFPQNEVDGRKATDSLIEAHLKTVRQLGLNFRLYDCRHTFATRAVEDGIDLVVLASILGHTNLKMVMRYAHPSEKQKADAVRLMEKSRQKQLKRAKLK